MRNGRRKLKAEAKVIGSLRLPARNNLGFWQRVECGIALNTVNMTGVRG
jgi:hypothetical protein